MANKVVKSDSEWRQQLTPEQYRIARQKGTERAFTGEYAHTKDEGVYRCVCCGARAIQLGHQVRFGHRLAQLLRADLARKNVGTESDDSFWMRRTEVMCNNCDAHLGHVFDDGPRPTGLGTVSTRPV